MIPSRLIALVAASALTASVAGCIGVSAGGDGMAPLTPTSRYSLQVEPGLERIALAVHETGVSPTQTAALRDLISRFAAEGAPAIVVEGPSGDDPVASRMAWAVRTSLEQSGVPGHMIQVVGYSAPDPRAPVLVGFETLRASVPQCGTNWTNLTRTANNAGMSNFGCAVTANLAAQIANPRDIIQPREMTPVDSNRRSVVFDNYRRGIATSAPQEELVANRRVANAVE